MKHRLKELFDMYGNPFHWFSDRKSTRLNSSHLVISYAVFCLKKKRRYYAFGNSLSDWVLNILNNGGVLAPYLCNPARKDFFMSTLEPLGYLPLSNIYALRSI